MIRAFCVVMLLMLSSHLASADPLTCYEVDVAKPTGKIVSPYRAVRVYTDNSPVRHKNAVKYEIYFVESDKLERPIIESGLTELISGSVSLRTHFLLDYKNFKMTKNLTFDTRNSDGPSPCLDCGRSAYLYEYALVETGASSFPVFCGRRGHYK